MHEHVHSVPVLPHGLHGAYARCYLSSRSRVENRDAAPGSCNPVANTVYSYVVCSARVHSREEDRITAVLRIVSVLHGICISYNICNSRGFVLHTWYQQVELLQGPVVQYFRSRADIAASLYDDL